MSSKACSPAAKLLRHSRLMSMPEPLAITPDHTSRMPPVAPYPTMQAIATPRTWAHRGNWGLKRDLPLERSKKTSFMRYGELDTINHMTTFESAHDHVYTHRKWQEMDLQISKEQTFDVQQNNRIGGDFDARPTVFDSDTTPENYKWRYTGPYTNLMTDAEITAFINKKVRPRREEFMKFVAKRLTYNKVLEEFKSQGIEDITHQDVQAAADKRAPEPVNMKALRQDRLALETMVAQFLDLPVQSQPYAVHPSGGLHYTRSSSHMANDPELGPQDKRAIVPGRELNMNGGINIVGVAGITAAVQRSTMHWTGIKTGRFDRMTVHKYRPLKAHLDARGKILLEVEQVRDGLQPQELGYGGYQRGARGSWGNVYQQGNGGWGGERAGSQRGGEQPEATDAVLTLLRRGGSNGGTRFSKILQG